MGAQPHLESVIQDTLIGKAIKKMCAEDKNACQILFNSAYYLAKQERPFSDFPDLLKLQEKNKTPGIKECYRNDRAAANFTDFIAKVTKDSSAKDLAKAHYFCNLSMEVQIVALLRKNLCIFCFFCVVSQRRSFFPLNQLIMPMQKVFIVALRKLLNELEC